MRLTFLVLTTRFSCLYTENRTENNQVDDVSLFYLMGKLTEFFSTFLIVFYPAGE